MLPDTLVFPSSPDPIPEPVSEPVKPRDKAPRPLRLPKLRHHKASGQAVVTIGGRDVYLGTWGSAGARVEYKRRVSEYLASGGNSVVAAAGNDLRVVELCNAYRRHAQRTYVNGRVEGAVRPVIARLAAMYGTARAVDFGPLALKALRHALIEERDKYGRRLSRVYINTIVKSVRGIFRWGVGEQLVPVAVLQALEAVDPLRRGRTDAPEPEPVLPVPEAHIESVLPHLPATVAAMVRLQRLTGMRPGEVCAMTTGEIDTTGAVWFYKPTHHKNTHRGQGRVVAIGPRAQEIVREYLKPDLSAPLFAPRESEAKRRERLRAENQTPFTPSRLKRDAKRARHPKRRYTGRYVTNTYGIAVRRACEAAGVPVWSPNRLRHSKATELRARYGLDVAGAVLGHARLDVTQIYAEKNMAAATAAALATG